MAELEVDTAPLVAQSLKNKSLSSRFKYLLGTKNSLFAKEESPIKPAEIKYRSNSEISKPGGVVRENRLIVDRHASVPVGNRPAVGGADELGYFQHTGKSRLESFNRSEIAQPEAAIVIIERDYTKIRARNNNTVDFRS